MSKLAEFRRAERELQKQMALLEQLQADASLQREMEFEDKLKALMGEYGHGSGEGGCHPQSATSRA